ncbi:MAG: hypothetical protein AAGB00_11345 [Planctomycetota bacterium]
MLASSLVGCGVRRRVGRWFNRGALCGGPAATAGVPVAGPVIMPAPAPVIVPQASCDPCCTPCQPVCGPVCDPCYDPCGGAGYMPTSYPVGGTYYDGECDCGGVSGTIGTVPSGVITDPGPAVQ